MKTLNELEKIKKQMVNIMGELDKSKSMIDTLPEYQDDNAIFNKLNEEVQILETLKNEILETLKNETLENIINSTIDHLFLLERYNYEPLDEIEMSCGADDFVGMMCGQFDITFDRKTQHYLCDEAIKQYKRLSEDVNEIKQYKHLSED